MSNTQPMVISRADLVDGMKGLGGPRAAVSFALLTMGADSPPPPVAALLDALETPETAIGLIIIVGAEQWRVEIR